LRVELTGCHLRYLQHARTHGNGKGRKDGNGIRAQQSNTPDHTTPWTKQEVTLQTTPHHASSRR
jgi:hypothetical protein